MAKMNWKECLDQGIITETTPDLERSKQMIKMSDLRFHFWDRDIDDKYTVLKVEAYYDIIRELLFAILYKYGFNCTNHLCLVAYLEKHFDDFDFEISKIDELRQIRNEISYRGFSVKKDYLETNEMEFKHIIAKLKAELEA